ncbi:MAG: hypothetical protein U0527_04960 [Candidatus Eisenbacteria bacterium]
MTALMLVLLAAIAFLYPRPDTDRALLLAIGAASLAQSWAGFWNYLFRGDSVAARAWLNLLQTALAARQGWGSSRSGSDRSAWRSVCSARRS